MAGYRAQQYGKFSFPKLTTGTKSYPAQPSTPSLPHATAAKTKNVNPAPAIIRMGGFTVAMPCDGAQPLRRAQEFADLEQLPGAPVLSARICHHPPPHTQDVTQTAASHTGSSLPGPAPIASQNSFSRNPCFPLWVTEQVGSHSVKTQSLPPAPGTWCWATSREPASRMFPEPLVGWP